LELALGASKRGIAVELFELASSCAGHVQSYEFVKLFSPWAINMTDAGREALRDLGMALPDEEAFPTGREYLDGYLQPLLDACKQNPYFQVHFESEVVAIARGTLLKGESIGGGDMCMPKNKPLCKRQRRETPFRLLVRQGENERFFDGFDFVADCSGSYKGDFANWAGAGGVPAVGERSLRASGRLHTIIPHVLGAQRERFAKRRTLVVGTGMSAATTIKNLSELASKEEGTSILWTTRRSGDPFTVIEDDVLPQRKALCEMGNSAARSELPGVEYIAGAVVTAIERTPDDRLRVTLETPEGEHKAEVDEFVGNCGFRPDMSLYQELQVHTCYASDGPIKLAATLLGGSGDCLKQVAAGVDTLKSPEPGFFILGHKSYGRSSAFLLKIGHEQVRVVLDELAPAAPPASPDCA